MSKKTLIKAVKVVTSSDKTKQIETFLSSLGVNTKADIYICSSIAYINIDTILLILSVDLSWFLKNSEIPLHYIQLSKGIFINKYGITKLLGQSKETISFKLQDYLYELLYQVETKESVTKDEIDSRIELLKETELSTKINHLSKELKMYRNVDLSNKQLIDDITSLYEVLKNDYAILNEENKKTKQLYSELEDEYKQLQNDYNSMKQIANTLAKYVRVKKSDVVEAYDDNLDVEDAEDVEDVEDTNLYKNAITAKNILKSKKTLTKKTKQSIQKTQKSNKVDNYNKYSLLRSANPIDNEYVYKWEISNHDYTKDFKNASTEYISSGEYVTDNIYGDKELAYPPEMIWYCDIGTTEEKIKAINLFLKISDLECTEQTISQLLYEIN